MLLERFDNSECYDGFTELLFYCQYNHVVTAKDG